MCMGNVVGIRCVYAYAYVRSFNVEVYGSELLVRHWNKLWNHPNLCSIHNEPSPLFSNGNKRRLDSIRLFGVGLFHLKITATVNGLLERCKLSRRQFNPHHNIVCNTNIVKARERSDTNHSQWLHFEMSIRVRWLNRLVFEDFFWPATQYTPWFGTKTTINPNIEYSSNENEELHLNANRQSKNWTTETAYKPLKLSNTGMSKCFGCVRCGTVSSRYRCVYSWWFELSSSLVCICVRSLHTSVFIVEMRFMEYGTISL